METNIHDVARKAHVSVSTVSRSFTRPELVSAKTRERVLSIAQDLDFSISRSATALKSGQSFRIAILTVGHITTWFNSTILEAFNNVFSKAGYDLSICQIVNADERNKFFLNLPVKRNVDAVIVTSFDIEAAEIDRLKTINVPIVSLNVASSAEFSASVHINDCEGAQLAARHLLRLGHTNIAYIRSGLVPSLHFSAQERPAAFVQTCEQAGVRPSMLLTQDSNPDIPQLLSDLMALPTLPTAIACQDDKIAVPLVFQLMRSGISVPSCMSVIGYDDGRFADEIGLTTIHQDPYSMASVLAHKTLDILGGKTVLEKHTTFPAKLIIRSSTAEPRQ